jgi:hypothetical protein
VTELGQGDDADGPSEDGPDFPRPRRRWVRVAVLVGVLVLAGLGFGLWVSGGAAPGALSGPEGVPIQQVPDLAPAATTMSGAPIDGIPCRTTMQQTVTYHIHVHLSIFVNGQQERIPAGSGIAAPRLDEHMTGGLFVDSGLSGCLYLLHVHANDGIIHVESPNNGVFTLGQFFDVWQQPLGPDEVGPAKGTVMAFENGKRFAGSPRDIPLLAHAVIQLDVGIPVVPFQPVTFKVTGSCGAGTRSCSAPSGSRIP